MLNMAWAIAAKDLRIVFSGAASLCQAFLLGLILIFIFSLSQGAGEAASPREAAAIFWISSVFCQLLIFGRLYGLEDETNARECLCISPAPSQGIWLGKSLGGLVLLLIGQAILLPAIIIFLGQSPAGSVLLCIGALAITDIGLAALGSMLGACGSGQSGSDALISILLFPLLLPLLLAATALLGQFFGMPAGGDTGTWLGIAIAFDGIFFSAGLLLFGFMYGGER